MPDVPQEPLSPLRCAGQLQINWFEFPEGPAPVQEPHTWYQFGGPMGYLGNHFWEFFGEVDVLSWFEILDFSWYVTINLPIQAWCSLNWTTQIISLATYTGPPEGSHLTPGHNGKIFGGCEQGTPWGLPELDLPRNDGTNNVKLRVARDLSPLATLLPAFANSPTVHGSLGNHSVVTGPVYPEGAIFGQTPPDRVLTYMRRKALRDFTTHPALLDRQEAFTSAATQWRSLSTQQQANWTAAGRTCRPRVAGYALFTEVLATKRLDLLPLLEARTGLSLVPPVYPT